MDELIARADELADAFEGYEPDDEDRGEPALMALRRVAHQRALLEGELLEASARFAGPLKAADLHVNPSTSRSAS